MKEPVKDFNQFSESTLVDKNQSKNPSSWKLFWEGYSRFYDRIKPVLDILWILVIGFFIFSHFGEFILARSLSTPPESPSPQEDSEKTFDESPNAELISVSQISDQSNIERNQVQINTEILNTLDFAYRQAEARAARKLDSYIDYLIFRVDDDFLNWYFGFYNKKLREDSVLVSWIWGENVKERQEKIFIEEFAKRVVNKTEAEQKIEQIVNDAAETYVSVLEHKLDRIGFKYNISQVRWNEYLDNITFNIPGTGNTTLAEISAVSAYPLVKAIAVPSLIKVSILGAERITAVAGAKYATKLGIKGASETAIGTFAKAADPIVLVGFVFWEVSEHYATVEEEKSALHDSLFETFQEIEDDILYDRNSGIMTTLYDIENSIRDSIVLRANSQQDLATVI